MVKITQQDLDLVTSAAQNAPLQNMAHAAALSQALQNFQGWVKYAEVCIAEVEAKPESPSCETPAE